MSTPNTSITQRKDIQYIKQAISEQNNNKQRLKEHRPIITSECVIVQKQFLICQICFWCASYYIYSTSNEHPKFDIYNLAAVQHCPGCSAKGTIESLPILQNPSTNDTKPSWTSTMLMLYIYYLITILSSSVFYR